MRVLLTADHLRLREFVAADADDLAALNADPRVMRYVSGGQPIPPELSREQHLPRYLAYHAAGSAWGYWVAEELPLGGFVGWFHLRPPLGSTDETVAELGYRLVAPSWGRGLATEGSRALVDYAFGLPPVAKVVATTLAENESSRRVLVKAGLRQAREFVYTGQPAWHVGRVAVEYALTREAWLATRLNPPA